MQVEKTVFISYRRTNENTARAVYQNLTANGYDTFLDFETIDSGSFERIILNQIAARAHFLIILTPSALERCNEPGDWLRREIEHAIELQRNIVPLLFEGFDFGAMSKYMTGQMAVLPQYNGVPVPRGYFEEAMTRLRTRFLNKPLAMILHPTPPDDTPVVEQQQIAAKKWTRVTKAQLTAEEYFERGFTHYEENEFEGAIADYTHAIRLNPQFADSYNNRGAARYESGDLKGAIADYTEAIRLDPQYASAYNNRGAARYESGDLKGAIADYTEAIRLDPQYANAYVNRGYARFEFNDLEGAKSDYIESLHTNPDDANAHYGLGNVHWEQGNLDSAVEAYAEVFRIDPERTDACVNCGEIFFELETYELSLDFFTTARDLDPADPFALAGLGISAHALGDLKSAKAYWQLLLDMDERYRNADWTGQQLNWREPLIAEARQLIAKL